MNLSLLLGAVPAGPMMVPDSRRTFAHSPLERLSSDLVLVFERHNRRVVQIRTSDHTQEVLGCILKCDDGIEAII